MVFSKDFLDSVVLSGWGLERGGHLGGNSVWRTRQLAQNKKKQKVFLQKDLRVEEYND